MITIWILGEREKEAAKKTVDALSELTAGLSEKPKWQIVTPKELAALLDDRTGNKIQGYVTVIEAGTKELAEELKLALFYAEGEALDAGGFRDEWMDADWYLRTGKHCRKLLEKCRNTKGKVPGFVQEQVLADIRACFVANMGNRNKGVLTGEKLNCFLADGRKALAEVSNSRIKLDESAQAKRRLPYVQWSALMDLKYGGDWSWEIRSEDAYLPVVTLELLEYEQGIWRIDCAVSKMVTEHWQLEVRKNGIKIPYRWTSRYAGVPFFGEPLAEKASFAVELPVDSLKKEEQIEFVALDGKTEVVLPVLPLDYQAKLPDMLENSYWCFDRYMTTLRREPDASGTKKTITGISLRRAGKPARMAQELRLFKEILCAPYGSKRMFLLRVLYWLTYPVYAKKNIWLTFDKLYKGGDCGEYFYKYMMTRRKDGVTPGYVIRADVPDYARLRQEGYEPLVYGSRKQKLMYLHASMIFATHSSVHAFCGFSKWEVRFVQDRLKAVNTCIQHGLSVQDLTFDSNRIVNNNKRYYCASPCEVENLSKPEYDYPAGVLRLTGIPRYDGLVNHDQKQILITPTWRAYIAMPAVMGSARPYNPEFKNTDYFKIFQELLSNERLKQAAKKSGYKILYLLHPVISAQKEDFCVDGNVELVSATEANYEKLLTESSLMVTDYSGVQFDFAYMRKPIVYFHPPKLPPHYVEGGFFYDTQGFGEICTETEQLVDTLCGYLESGCELKEFYRERQDRFFAFDDHESCKRIFEDAKAYMAGK